MSRFNIFDYIFILRPLILIPCWNFLLIGAYLGQGHGGFNSTIILGLVIYTCVMGGVYILNQIMDRETDRANKKLFLLSEEYMPISHAYVQMVILWVIASIIALRFTWHFLVLIGISLVIGIMYSVPPMKLKGKPVLDTLANGFGYGMINFAVGWMCVAWFDWTMFSRFIPYFLSICAVFMNTTVVDMEGDRRAGEFSTALLLEVKPTLAVSTVLMGSAVVVAWLMKDLVCGIPALLSFPVFFYVLVVVLKQRKTPRQKVILSFRLPGVLFTLATIYLYPLYAVLILLSFVGMRLYYKYRFGMTYPTLSSG
jgi:4-hydroxybenzoate polyprenyltransferase